MPAPEIKGVEPSMTGSLCTSGAGVGALRVTQTLGENHGISNSICERSSSGEPGGAGEQDYVPADRVPSLRQHAYDQSGNEQHCEAEQAEASEGFGGVFRAEGNRESRHSS